MLVVGGAGFVGSHVARALLLRGTDVLLCDTSPRLPDRLMVERQRGQGGLVHVELDVGDTQAVAEVIRRYEVRKILHAAAVLPGRESTLGVREYVRINTDAVWGLCELVATVPSVDRMVVVSTRSVYAGYTGRLRSIDEGARPFPVGVYGATKAAGDLGVEVYKRHRRIDAAVARITGAYGPGQWHRSPLLEMATAAVEGRRHGPVDPGFSREYSYVKDLTRGLLRLLDAAELVHDVYHVSSGRQHTLRDVADAIQAHIPGAIYEMKQVEDTTARPTLSIQRMEREFGFRPQWSLTQGVGELLEWIKTGSYGREVCWVPTLSPS